MIGDIVEQVQETQRYGYTNHLDLHDTNDITSGIEKPVARSGPDCRINRWIGVDLPDTDTTDLTVQCFHKGTSSTALMSGCCLPLVTPKT